MLRFFSFDVTPSADIYTLSLHDALPIYDFLLDARHLFEGHLEAEIASRHHDSLRQAQDGGEIIHGDRKSTRLNSSHGYISYAVFCLKKKTHDYTFRLPIVHTITLLVTPH